LRSTAAAVGAQFSPAQARPDREAKRKAQTRKPTETLPASPAATPGQFAKFARMRKRILLTVIGIIGAAACFAAEPSSKDNPGEGWKLSRTADGVTIYSRPHSNSSLKEFKAIGDIDAPSRAVHGVIADFESYSAFMPYTAECRLLKREPGSFITYQRISPKVCSDRDYTLRVRESSWPGPGGLVYLNKWEPANASGPPENPGVLRVNVCEGAWLLEPAGTDKTHATYSVYTDTGGLIPSFIANHFAQVGIGKIFAAVRKQVKNSKYNTAQE
jgi:hypothetical protein